MNFDFRKLLHHLFGARVGLESDHRESLRLPINAIFVKLDLQQIVDLECVYRGV